MSSRNFAFEFLDIGARPVSRPRTVGTTMMIDWGLPTDLQKTIIETQGIYIDEAKIAATIASKLPVDILTRKISMYTDAGIFCFAGGLFAEIALSQGKIDQYMAECQRLGFSGLEISDNFIKISSKNKHKIISHATNDLGLVVMGEVGGKEGFMDVAAMIDDVHNCLDAGAHSVLIEAYELFNGSIREEDIETLFGSVPAERIMIELPVDVIHGITKSYKIDVLYWLIRKFGSNINLANVEWDEVYFTEIARCRACGDASSKYSYEDKD